MSETITTVPVTAPEPKRRSMLVDTMIRLLKEKPLGTVGAIIVVIFFLTGIFADFIAPYGMNDIHPGYFLKPPSPQFILGTDSLGRDLFSRIIYGARISMVTGLSASGIAVLIGVIIGSISGFFGGKFDLVTQRFVDAFMCFPWIFLVLTVMAIVGPGLLQVILVLGTLQGVRNSRVIRGAVISIKENMYVEAARSIGASRLRILSRHILPNVMAPIIVIFTILVGGMILFEATLSFLGYGIPPPIPSWGGMLSIGGRRYMEIAPWLAIWPGLALSIVVFGVNMFGDALRDLLDPRLRGGLGRYGGAKAKRSRK